MADVAQILLLEERRRRAMLAAEEQALLGLLAPDLRYVHSTGVAETRDTLIAKLVCGQIAYRHLCFDRLVVTCMEDGGVVSGEMRAQVLRGGDFRDIATCYLAAWMRRKGEWQLAAYQGTTLPSP